jgi:hypothetical protein
MSGQQVLTKLLAIVLLIWGLTCVAYKDHNEYPHTPGKLRVNQLFFASREYGHLHYRQLRKTSKHHPVLSTITIRSASITRHAEHESEEAPARNSSMAAADLAQQRVSPSNSTLANTTEGGSSMARILAGVEATSGSTQADQATSSQSRCGCPASGTPWCNYITGQTITNLCIG